MFSIFVIGSELFDESYGGRQRINVKTVSNVTRYAAGMVISEVLFSFPVCLAAAWQLQVSQSLGWRENHDGNIALLNESLWVGERVGNKHMPIKSSTSHELLHSCPTVRIKGCWPLRSVLIVRVGYMTVPEEQAPCDGKYHSKYDSSHGPH